MRPAPSITYLETASTGHCPVWVQSVADAFSRLKPSGHLHVWLPPDFRKIHSGWAEKYFAVTEQGESSVRFSNYNTIAMGCPKNQAAIPSYRDILLRCSQLDRSNVCFIANHLDRELKNIAWGQFNSLTAKLVGVMDYPYLHYCRFGVPQNAAWLPKMQYVKRYIINLMALRRRIMGRILMVDPLATPFYRQITLSKKYEFVPELLSGTSSSNEPRIKLELPEQRTILLFIGGTEKRKGICELLCAVEAMLFENTELQNRVAFVLAGRIITETKESVHVLLGRLRGAFPNTPIIVRDELLPEQQFVDYIAAADVICIPYLALRGTSGILVHAAHAKRPVLSSDFGIVGELVRKYGLGLTCDTSSVEAIKNTLVEALRKRESGELIRNAKMAEFIRDCAIPSSVFGETIVRHLVEIAAEVK